MARAIHESDKQKVDSARHHEWRTVLRRTWIGLLVAVGCLGFSTYVIVHWAERQVLTTDNWVALVSPLPKQPVVNTALGTYISQQIFAAVPVQQKIADALPPQAGFLAGPLTSQLNNLTNQAAQRVVASDTFQTLWAGANRVAMNRLLASARGQTPPLQSQINERFNIDLSQSKGQVSQALGKAAEAIPALQPASTKALQVSADLQARPRRLQQVVKTTDSLAAILPLLVIACFLGAIAAAKARRHTTMVFAATIIILMLVELIALKWLRQETLSQVHNSANLAAVGYIYDSLVGWLKHMIYIVLLVMVVLLGLLLLGGPASWQKRFRSFIRLEQLSSSRVMKWWRGARQWVRRWEYYLWLVVGVMVLAIVALVATVSGRVVINSALLILNLLALIHIIATPRSNRLAAS